MLYVIHVLYVRLPFVFIVIQRGNTKNIQNRYISLLFQTLMSIVTAGVVVIHLELSKVNCMNAPSALVDIYFTLVVTMKACIQNTLIISRKKAKKEYYNSWEPRL